MVMCSLMTPTCTGASVVVQSASSSAETHVAAERVTAVLFTETFLHLTFVYVWKTHNHNAAQIIYPAISHSFMSTKHATTS